jgi:hypothetical protein
MLMRMIRRYEALGGNVYLVTIAANARTHMPETLLLAVSYP